MTEKPLIKVLTEAGIGSRRRMTEAIKQGQVKVNGKVAESFNHPVDTAKDRILFNGRPVAIEREEVICLMLNKPEGIVSTASDEMGRRTVLDILPQQYRQYRLYPVGRLDIDTTGLLLLTNDGDLTYRLTHPKFEYEKEYLVQINGKLTPEEKRKLEHGILLEDGLTHPAKVKEIAAEPFNYSIVIHEGKKRQVRRMFERLKQPVISLKRVRVGGLRLGDLAEGSIRPLTAKEIQTLRGNLTGDHKKMFIK
jgi:23S rRNA pseudouridine2605 synthase